MIGIAFSSESEAADLFKKVSLRHKYAAKASGGGGGSSSSAAVAAVKSSSKSSKKKKGGIDKSMIGAPTGFSHVAHMGFDAQEGFSTRNIDPSWERLFQQLEGQGISRVRRLFLLLLPPSLLLSLLAKLTSPSRTHARRARSRRTSTSSATLSRARAGPTPHRRLLQRAVLPAARRRLPAKPPPRAPPSRR